ncbi:MAG TPA: class I SAM-dependent methyltransferase [Acetobacteraceae bacterium]|jgi:ubiquinone/menaquinone biosynthesis C-methylase UbiE
MLDIQSRFQCPACKGVLLADAGVCLICGRGYITRDGILDFVGGRLDTQLDAYDYDASHTIDDDSAEIGYLQLRQVAGHRWPASLGAVVEIGCGTGGFSRAMVGHRDATDAVLTDVSLDMLRVCRGHLDRLGIASALPVRFATYSANEACFRDTAFDTCVGASVVHHIADVRGFLADVWRFLKPGGRACFIEPSLRYHRVLAMAFADIIAMLLARDATYTTDRQTLHNWVAEARRGVMLQGDLALLAGYEDKHMFVGEAFEAVALEAGFATAEALPSSRDPDGLGGVGGLLARLRVGEPLAGQVTRLWPSYANRYLSLLNGKDLSLGYLFRLTKSAQPRAASPPARVAPREPRYCEEDELTGGGVPLRWVLTLTAQSAPTELRVKIEGWCLANADLKSVRVTIGAASREAPVWLPRADVHLALNADRSYATWNSLCCGISSELRFDAITPADGDLACSIDLVFDGNRFVPITRGGTLRPGVPFEVAR